MASHKHGLAGVIASIGGGVWGRGTGLRTLPPCPQTAAARVHMRTKVYTAAAQVNLHRTRVTPRGRTFRYFSG
jgi:hypothetical protein